MLDATIILPSKPKIIQEDEVRGIYEIDGLYPGYGHTLGNSLRRIIWSSLVGTAITAVKIEGVTHEFDTLPGVKEDIVTIILNLKKLRFRWLGEEGKSADIDRKGKGQVTGKDINVGGEVEILNSESPIATLTDSKASLAIELTLEKGLGYVPKESLQHDRNQTGVIYLDAVFTPIQRVSYEVENMRVGGQTNFNRLRLVIETDATLTPRAALEKSIEIMVAQLQAMIGFKQEVAPPGEGGKVEEVAAPAGRADNEVLKIKIEELDFSTRTANALGDAGIRSLGGLSRKKAEDLLAISGLGEKGLQEIKKTLTDYGLILK